MAALRTFFLIAASVLAFERLAAAQITQIYPPPAAATPPDAGVPPASAAPGNPPPAPPSAPPGGPQTPSINQPPPPGYQQPPAGYQQQPPGGYPQQPPPGYTQQPPPGYYQQPPPGYYQPPPGYYQPPPGYYPPPGTYQQPPPRYAPQPPPPPPRTHGFLALPYIGVHTHTGSASGDLGTGGTLGVLLGGRLTPSFSINGELRLDSLHFRNVPAGASRTGTQDDLAFSPLFHVQFQTGELVVGPKIGLYGASEQDTMNGVSQGKYDTTGVSYGANAGVFFAVSRIMSLGGMVSYTVRDANKVCHTAPGGAMSCQTGNYPTDDVFGFLASMLF